MLEKLDVQLNVLDRRNLDPEARQQLIDAPEFSRLPNDMSLRLFALPASGPNHVTAEIQGAAVLIMYDWVMQIQADNMIRCVQTLCIIVNAIIRETGKTVALHLVTPVGGEDRLLYRIMEEEDQRAKSRDRFRDLKIGVISSIIGGIVVLLVQWFIFGGLLS